MEHRTEKHHRRTIRLKGYDYSQIGYYFVTICTANRSLYFEDAEMRRIAEDCWLGIPKHFNNVVLDEYVIMPNHIHGIIILNDVAARFIVPNGSQSRGSADDKSKKSGGATHGELGDRLGFDKSNRYRIKNNPMRTEKHTLGKIIRFYKAKTTHVIRNIKKLGSFAWQRNYYEHIIRNDKELYRIREYIQNNPLNWDLDRENPDSERFGIEQKIYWQKIYNEIDSSKSVKFNIPTNNGLEASRLRPNTEDINRQT